jgi:hypothetical protein
MNKEKILNTICHRHGRPRDREVEGENSARNCKKLRICARLEEVGGNCTSSHEWSPIKTGNKYNSAGSTAIRNTFFFKDLTSTLVLKRQNCMYYQFDKASVVCDLVNIRVLVIRNTVPTL